MSYKISITTSMTARATPCLIAISVVPTSSLASFAARVVHLQPRIHPLQVSAMAFTSVQVAMRKDVLVAASVPWILCSAGPCKFCILIITGLCKPSRASVWINSPRSTSSKVIFLSLHHLYTYTPSHTVGKSRMIVGRAYLRQGQRSKSGGERRS
jgi:hypothetical protein